MIEIDNLLQLYHVSYVLCGWYLYGEDHGLVATLFLGCLRVKSFLRLSHETGL